jgi:hypothetical protein
MTHILEMELIFFSQIKSMFHSVSMLEPQNEGGNPLITKLMGHSSDGFMTSLVVFAYGSFNL